jgi:hypothetical protein
MGTGRSWETVRVCMIHSFVNTHAAKFVRPFVTLLGVHLIRRTHGEKRYIVVIEFRTTGTRLAAQAQMLIQRAKLCPH